MFKGFIPALVTPFKNGEIDFPAFEAFIAWQIEQGASGLVPCGTTGESPTLSHEEHNAVVRRTIEVARGRVPVIAGTGSNATAKTIKMTKDAQEMGADAALIVVPYYNKPTQDGLFAHYKAVHDATDIPIILYNIPGRSVIDMHVDTMARLAELPRIIGVKDATNDLGRPMITREKCGVDFCQLSGEDGTAAAFFAHGGHGCISVMANVAPRQCADMFAAWENGDLKTFARLRDSLAPLARDLFCETNPAPVKYALSRLGRCTDEVRLPLIAASDPARAKIDAAMKHAGLL